MKKFLLLICLIFSNAFASDISQDPRASLTFRIFNELRHNNTEILNDFYTQDVEFVDPIGSLSGLNAMKNYYKNMYKEVESIRFDFTSFSNNGDRYHFSWDMHLKTPNLNSGEEFTVSGVSEIHFDGELVRYHRDYFDMGEFIYERLPVLGRIVRLIKERLEYKE